MDRPGPPDLIKRTPQVDDGGDDTNCWLAPLYWRFHDLQVVYWEIHQAKEPRSALSAQENRQERPNIKPAKDILKKKNKKTTTTNPPKQNQLLGDHTPP